MLLRIFLNKKLKVPAAERGRYFEVYNMKRVSAEEYKKRIDLIRKEMSGADIDFYYVPDGDFHMSEYVSDFFKGREYLSGFDGSNGQMVITADEALLWTDGRYFLQAAEQLEGTGIILMKMGEPGVKKIPEFLISEMPEGQTLGFDGRVVPYSFYEQISETLDKKNVKIICDIDLVGNVWNDRPSLPSGKAWILDDKYSGNTVSERLVMVREKLEKDNCDALILSALDETAWLFGFRGEDVEYNPVTLSFAYISMDEALLFMDDDKACDIKDALEKSGVTVKKYDEIFSYLKNNSEGKKILIDCDFASTSLINSLSNTCEKVNKNTPVRELKACKTGAEIENERSAHISDGVAVTRILHDIKMLSGSEELKAGNVTELDIAEKLLSYRKEAEDFIEESFAPIVATGAHGAIIHYEPTPETNAVIKEGDMVLLDTGGQYLRGTTDITRTVIIGKPTDKMKKYYTAVLKGNIALSEAVFREGTSGKSLDIYARKPLWEIGIDYNHGTGHGVGFLLNVHEGPQSISVNAPKAYPFMPGMITSDEPGVYIEGEFGIRTENMTVCVEKNVTEFGKFLGFDVLTLVPYDRDLIDCSMLDEEEIRIIDSYHEKVYQKLAPFFDEKTALWLKDITRPLIDLTAKI